MRHELANGHPFLAAVGKFRPVVGNARIEIKLSVVRDAHDGDGAKRFADGEEVDDCVTRPVSLARDVRPAAPQVNHDATVVPDGYSTAALAALFEILGKLSPDRGKLFFAKTRDKRRFFTRHGANPSNIRSPYPEYCVSGPVSYTHLTLPTKR